MFFRFLTRVFTRLIKVFVRFTFRVEIKGLDHLPTKGGALVVCNHVSFLDNLILIASLPRELGFVMAKKVYDHWLLNGFTKRLPMVPVVTGKGKGYLEEFNTACQKTLNEGGVLCIFPEGQVSRNGHLLGFKRGLEHICKGVRRNVPIIPVHIQGLIGSPLSYDNVRQTKLKFRFKNFFKRITLTVGRPLKNSSSAFGVRNAVKELETANVSKVVESQGNLFHVLQSSGMNSDPVFMKAQTLALKLEAQLNPYRLVTVDSGLKEEDKIIANLVCAILGKVVLNECSTSLKNDKKTRSEYLITSDDLNVHSLKKSSGKLRLRNIYGNESLAVFESGNGSYSLSHVNVLAYFVALKQLFDLGENSFISTEYDLSHSIGYFLRIWAPLLSKSKVVSGDSLEHTTVLVGGTSYVNEFYSLFPKNELKVVILLDHHVASLDSRVDKGIVFTGLHGRSVCPVLTLNSPDFKGESLEGKVIRQYGKDDRTVGRPLPGISIKIVDEKGVELRPLEKGEVLTKGCFFSEPGWVNSGLKGALTEEGFLTV